METLQIDKANALKAHEEASIKGKTLLENLLKKDLQRQYQNQKTKQK